MKRTLALSLAIIASSIVSADITGKWVGSMSGPGLKTIAPAGAKVVNKGGPTYTLILDKGGKYKMETKNPNGKDTKTEGTWKLSGSELTLMPSAESKKISPMIQDRKLKVGTGEKSLTLEVKAKMMSAPVTVKGGKVDAKDEEHVKKMMANAKEMTMVVEFKRP